LLAARKGKKLVYVVGVGTGFNQRNAYELREMVDGLITSTPAASVALHALDFQPVAEPAGTIGRVKELGDDALKPMLAGARQQLITV
ncbi:hypothetical protein ACC699_38750, partial [Rhizobium ruizarguesonis]